MPHYRLHEGNGLKPLPDDLGSVSACDRAEALELLGQKLKCKLSLQEPLGPPSELYLMSENHNHSDWSNPDIRVYVVEAHYVQ
jgi:hypothetical protein